ncbi:MAG TPA: HD domain-containing phosphohydrolase, partial [Dehalococcoidia bacterium]|nr:HD domain-containing phosphohydrolase [Dehalococcoidia bacterium]
GGMLSSVGRLVRASHERFDGLGYPDGLAGQQIPIESRIVSACDAFSAMTTDRAYRPALSVAEAVDELQRCAATQFDPIVVRVLVEQVLARAGAEARLCAA